MMPYVSIRGGQPADLAEVAAIQTASPEAAQWNAADYLNYELRVFISESRVAGFLVSRVVAPGECELLNLAVAPEFRRRGVARTLVQSLAAEFPGEIYLEVRESNEPARRLYAALGFQESGVRPKYYHSPAESAIVMKFHSCYRVG
jgi:ribosomal-protein-alanine N-acetyltransferase